MGLVVIKLLHQIYHLKIQFFYINGGGGILSDKKMRVANNNTIHADNILISEYNN